VALLSISWLVQFETVRPTPSLLADDWPQAQGLMRDNKSAEQGLLHEWPEAGPELLWTFDDAGVGYSGPAIVDGRLFVMGARAGGTELLAIDVEKGTEVWSSPVNDKAFDFEGNSWGSGPRATPTVSDGIVYALAGDGQLACASAANGKVLWRKHMVSDLGGRIKNVGAGEPVTLGWGFCWAPLVDGEQLICTPGGSDGLVVALDRTNGDVLWRSGALKEDATYSSPVAATIEGVRQYIVMTQLGVASVSAEDGKQLWYYERRQPYPDVVIPTPVYHEGQVYVSIGYGVGCELIQLAKQQDGKFSAEKVYANRIMKNTLGGFVLHEGFVYGCSEGRGWTCQDFTTGKRRWNKRGSGGVGDGSVIYADGHLYLYSERDADVALIEANSDSWVEKGRFRLPCASERRGPSGRNWTHPVIADGKLYLRDQELLFCYNAK
jgi:outer membrane protein assembly factor BamB